MVYQSRREFVKNAGLGILALVAAPALINCDSKRRAIPFEEALSNPGLRQQYINQLVEKEFGKGAYKYIDSFIYDRDGSLAKSETASYIDRFRDDPRFLELIAPDYLRSRRLRGIDITEKDVSKFLKSQKGEWVLEDILKQFKIEYEKQIDEGEATTLQYLFDFGKKAKSKVYIKERIFEKDGEYEPTGEIIRSALMHEYSHAEDFFNGINLKEGLSIDASNHSKINGRAVSFVSEMRAYEKQLQFSGKFGRKNPAYKISAYTFADFIYKNALSRETALKPKDFTPYENKLISYYMDRLNNLNKDYPEVLFFIEFFMRKRVY